MDFYLHIKNDHVESSILKFLYINPSVKNIMVTVPLEYCLIMSLIVFSYYANIENS